MYAFFVMHCKYIHMLPFQTYMMVFVSEYSNQGNAYKHELVVIQARSQSITLEQY